MLRLTQNGALPACMPVCISRAQVMLASAQLGPGALLHQFWTRVAAGLCKLLFHEVRARGRLPRVCLSVCLLFACMVHVCMLAELQMLAWLQACVATCLRGDARAFMHTCVSPCVPAPLHVRAWAVHASRPLQRRLTSLALRPRARLSPCLPACLPV